MRKPRRKRFTFKIIESSKDFLVGTYVDSLTNTVEEAIENIEHMFFGAGFDEVEFEYDHSSNTGTMKAFG